MDRIIFDALVRKFCIRKLAQILYECVETNTTDRALLDWFTAESAFDKIHWSSQMSGIFLMALAEEFDRKANTERRQAKIDPNVINYETFDRLCGRAVWDYLYQPCKGMLPKEYTKIRFH
ncbi:MAG: hypothetical protein A2639_02785 [Candidatus Staskawiczbacteria bacterium RIFCSPHIGHO2_01_FULL_34_27]|uniref:Uncharacterized protein n=2 Tax=Candidatus Staskawicziibacteriota TaxID=1817916 RepID=A0A1G2HJY6_9BACT|nr:MAG: hypothetical protein A2639_02785 [Candidatus Staskawiczbacteria bacterium RIFCSPHIGHO2_01_FULL_34_27]OGZ69533.1 MAG: hypothetical protein A3D35_01305 [Candidatus Staskawiczbacteria bacterium RIFCSPHIGHO2_02_FULL_34_9]